MKIYFTLFLFTSAVYAFGQTMVDTGKVWHIAECMNSSVCGSNRYSFGSDTTIGGHVYKLLIANYDSSIVGNTYEPIAMREDTAAKQVFFYQTNGEKLIYDFSLNPGATYNTTIDYCDMIVMVDIVDSVTLLNGEKRKRMLVTLTFNGGGCLFGSYQESWIEGIGSEMGPTRAGYYLIAADISANLICFEENDTLKYYNNYYGSCTAWTVGVNDISSKNNLSILPNPFHTTSQLELKNYFENAVMRIYNSFGKNVMQQNIISKTTTISREGLSDGIYFYQLISNEGNVTAGKMMIE